MSVKAGIQHLSERLEGVKLDEAPVVSFACLLRVIMPL